VVVQAGIAELRSHPHHEIGAGDAIHLATAVGIASEAEVPLGFVTSDQGLYTAARAHGLRVLDPNYEGVERLDALPS
jgi:hypothetical protein